MDFSHIHENGPANGNGAVIMPRGPASQLPMPTPRHNRNSMSMSAFEGPRSPPNPKSTSHVPCKFFKVGQCQAGKACPFSHALEATGDEICKYFQKGNCKFGQKCALAHVLPNGRRVNRPNNASRPGPEFGGRIDPQLYPLHDPVMAQSILAQQTGRAPGPFMHQMPPPFPENNHSLPIPRDRGYDGIPTIDTDFASPQYGSPSDRSRGASSQAGHLNVLDAPLPASFDSQGISYIARHGPVAASLPSKLAPELSSPPSTLHKFAAPAESSNTLQHSLAAQRNPRFQPSDLASSPLTSDNEGQTFRSMHSQRISKPRILSASLPRGGLYADDWDDGFHFSEGEETDYIPSSLHDQILTPQEKMRRTSRNDQDNRSVRESLSGLGTPGDPSSKVGSPNAGSPSSRYGAFFARRSQDANSNLAISPSAFGPVGSPLRNLHPSTSPSLRATREQNNISPSFPAFASPPRHSSMSILSQQLGRTRISAKQGESGENPNNLHPNSARNVSAPNSGFGRSYPSSTNRDRIEEELGEGIFSLEEDEEVRSKRNSGSNSGNVWGAVGSGRAPEWS